MDTAFFRTKGFLRTLACLVILGASLLWTPQQSFAAERDLGSSGQAVIMKSMEPDPFGEIETKLKEIADAIRKLSTPIAILGIIMVLLLLLFSPLLPEMAQQHKGYIMRALMIVSVISLIPEIVNAFASLGS